MFSYKTNNYRGTELHHTNAFRLAAYLCRWWPLLNRRFTKTALLAILLNLSLSFSAFANSPDWTAYAKVLQTVMPGTKYDTSLALVDYAALKKSGQLEAVYQQIKVFPVKTLTSKEEKLAFYINAYNILAIKIVLDNWPLTSIKDVGNLLSPVWGKTAGIIDGEEISLDTIENDILRPMGEPRIHFAIVCASVSCPDLRAEPYTAEKLNSQLDEQISQFLNNPKKGLSVDSKAIHVSKIFDWFEKDFKSVGGVEAFIRHYKAALPTLPIEADIKYIWFLNGIDK
ncbi:MAG: DUF547 domain-containing protein [Methylococcales bacterium]